MVLKIWNITV